MFERERNIAVDILVTAYNLRRIDEDTLIKAIGQKNLSHLKKVKKLVSKDGKVFMQTFYVKNDDYENPLKVKTEYTKFMLDTKDLDKLGGSLHYGDDVFYTHKGMKWSGEVASFSFNEQSGSYYIGILPHGGDKVVWKKLSSGAVLQKKSGVESKTEGAINPYSYNIAVTEPVLGPQDAAEAKLDEPDFDWSTLVKEKIYVGTGEVDQNGYEFVKSLGGSTGAKLMVKDGKPYVKKTGNSPEHLANEVRTIKYLSQIGVPVQKVNDYIKGEAVYLEYIEGVDLGNATKAGGKNYSKVCGKIFDSFAAHALIMNWDMVGLSSDNIIIDKTGNPVFVDVGGSLGFRAQGEKKKEWDAWNVGNFIGEFASMTDPNLNLVCAATLIEGYNNKTGNEIPDGQSLNMQVDFNMLIYGQLLKIKKSGAEWVNGPSEFSKKLSERLDAAIKMYSVWGIHVDDVKSEETINKVEIPKEPEKEKPSTPYQLLQEERKNCKVYKQNVKDITDLYNHEIKMALSVGRNDIANFYKDLAVEMAMTQSELDIVESEYGYSYSSGKKVDFMKEMGLSARHIKVIDNHTGGPDKKFLQLIDGLNEDGYNVDFKSGKAIGFNKVWKKNIHEIKTKTKNDGVLLTVLKLKIMIEAFALAKKSGGQYFSEKTLYRGIDLDSDARKAYEKQDNWIITPIVNSCSVNEKSAFTRNTRVVTTGVESLEIQSISGYEGEKESITKPFSMMHISRFVNEYHEGYYYHVRAERPGLLPYKKDEYGV